MTVPRITGVIISRVELLLCRTWTGMNIQIDKLLPRQQLSVSHSSGECGNLQIKYLSCWGLWFEKLHDLNSEEKKIEILVEWTVFSSHRSGIRENSDSFCLPQLAVHSLFSAYSHWVFDIKWPSHDSLKSCNVLAPKQLLKSGKESQHKKTPIAEAMQRG